MSLCIAGSSRGCELIFQFLAVLDQPAINRYGSLLT
jgi:hypothetical protein